MVGSLREKSNLLSKYKRFSLYENKFIQSPHLRPVTFLPSLFFLASVMTSPESLVESVMEFYESNFYNLSNMNERSIDEEGPHEDDIPADYDSDSMSEITR